MKSLLQSTIRINQIAVHQTRAQSFNLISDSTISSIALLVKPAQTKSFYSNLRSFTTTTTTSSLSAPFIIYSKNKDKLWFRVLIAAGFAFAISDLFYTMTAENKSSEKTPPKGSGLTPDEWRQFTLREVHPYNYNTKKYIFNVESTEAHANVIPVSSCVMFKFVGSDGKAVIRPYTPISSKAKDELTFLIKEYPQGVMSKHVAHLKPGETIEMKGPFPKLKYEANMKKRIGMVAGGTGITPMLQVIEKILDNPKDKTHVDLIFANTSPRDILLREVLENYGKTNGDRFKVTYLVDKSTIEGQTEKWNGTVGHVNEQFLKGHLPPPSKDNLIYVCGPPGFMAVVSGDKAPDKSQGELSGALKQLGYDKDMVYKF